MNEDKTTKSLDTHPLIALIRPKSRSIKAFKLKKCLKAVKFSN